MTLRRKIRSYGRLIERDQQPLRRKPRAVLYKTGGRPKTGAQSDNRTVFGLAGRTAYTASTQDSVGLAVPSMLIYAPRGLPRQPIAVACDYVVSNYSQKSCGLSVLKYTRCTDACLPSVVSRAVSCRVVSPVISGYSAWFSCARFAPRYAASHTDRRRLYMVSVGFCGVTTSVVK